jgi:hypothetical protein
MNQMLRSSACDEFEDLTSEQAAREVRRQIVLRKVREMVEEEARRAI